MICRWILTFKISEGTFKTSDLTSKHARLRSARYDDADIVTRDDDDVKKAFSTIHNITIRPIQSNIAVHSSFVLKNTRSALKHIE